MCEQCVNHPVYKLMNYQRGKYAPDQHSGTLGKVNAALASLEKSTPRQAGMCLFTPSVHCANFPYHANHIDEKKHGAGL